MNLHARLFGFATSLKDARPQRMLQGARPALPDDRFRPLHSLYRRCKVDEVLNGHLTGVSIAYDNMSTNWSKYSRPWDVLFDAPNPGYGIASFRVHDLPENLPTEDPPGTPVKPHSFYPRHRPCANNYSHSEIWTYRDGVRIQNVSARTVKKEFRQLMSDRSFIILFPNN